MGLDGQEKLTGEFSIRDDIVIGNKNGFLRLVFGTGAFYIENLLNDLINGFMSVFLAVKRIDGTELAVKGTPFGGLKDILKIHISRKVFSVNRGRSAQIAV